MQILVDILAVAAADCLALIKVEDPDAGTKKNGSDNKYLLVVEITTPCMKIKPIHSFWLFWINIFFQWHKLFSDGYYLVHLKGTNLANFQIQSFICGLHLSRFA